MFDGLFHWWVLVKYANQRFSTRYNKCTSVTTILNVPVVFHKKLTAVFHQGGLENTVLVECPVQGKNRTCREICELGNCFHLF